MISATDKPTEEFFWSRTKSKGTMEELEKENEEILESLELDPEKNWVAIGYRGLPGFITDEKGTVVQKTKKAVLVKLVQSGEYYWTSPNSIVKRLR